MEKSGSRTKQSVIQKRLANALLQAPILSPVRGSPRDLGVDHPTVLPDSQMIEHAVQALQAGQTHYADVPGIQPLREALAGHFRGMGIAGCEAANVLVTAGMQEARFLSIQVLGGLLGCLAIPETVHPGARKAAGVRQLPLRFLSTREEDGFLPEVSEIRKALEGGCRLLYLESPVRLTGAVFDTASVQEIASLIQEFDAGVIWDQGMAPWVSNYASLGAEAAMLEATALIGEVCPGMGLESWFVGYIATKEDWIKPICSQKQIISICTSTPSQFAAVKAAEIYPAFHPRQLEELTALHRKGIALAQEVGIRPLKGSASNVIALRALDPPRVKAALSRHGFVFADGADFGAGDVLRLSVTHDDALGQALGTLR